MNYGSNAGIRNDRNKRTCSIYRGKMCIRDSHGTIHVESGEQGSAVTFDFLNQNVDTLEL